MRVILTLLLGIELMALVAGTVLAIFSWPLPLTAGGWGFPGFQGVAAAVFTLSAIPIIRNRPGNPIGWLLLTVALLSAAQFVGQYYAAYGLLASPGAVPAAWVGLWIGAWIWLPTVALLGTTALYFPTGRLPSRRWQLVPWATAAGIACGSLVLAIGYWGDADPGHQTPLVPSGAPALVGSLAGIGLGLVVFGVVAGSASVIVRFRSARGVEREQLKWLAFAGVTYAAAFVIYVAANALGQPQTIATSLTAIAFLGLPVSIGIAIVRHRLYDIDRIINRTLVYTAVTIVLATVYAASVIALQAALDGLVHTTQPAVAASTLLVAVLFQPVRGRLQTAVDRRFDRARYDAERTVAAFSERLRDQVELDALLGEVVKTTDSTVAPASTAVWIRDMRVSS
jgi:hypothetical protein